MANNPYNEEGKGDDSEEHYLDATDGAICTIPTSDSPLTVGDDEDGNKFDSEFTMEITKITELTEITKITVITEITEDEDEDQMGNYQEEEELPPVTPQPSDTMTPIGQEKWNVSQAVSYLERFLHAVMPKILGITVEEGMSD